MLLTVRSDKYKIYNIEENDDSKRVDNVIRRFLPNLPLKTIFKAIRNGDIRIDSKKIKQNYKLKVGDNLYIYRPLLNFTKEDDKSNSKITLDKKRIVFENKHILIYNKPTGEIVHGERDSLDIKVKNYLKNKIKESLSFSPGPLHRLDRNTQGLITFSVSLLGARTFTELLKNREIEKYYLTVVDGSFNKKEIWEDTIERDEKSLKSFKSPNGKSAKTIFTPLLSKRGKTLALVEIKTGRTHQIRVHCSIHNRPLTGDTKYNINTRYKNYFLSAISLSFTKNSAILDRGTFTLPINNKTHPLLSELFSSDELKSVEHKVRELI